MTNKIFIDRKEEVILSGYIRYRPINKTYYLMVNSKMLSQQILKYPKNIKVSVSRKDNLFIINKNEGGNLLKPRKRELVTCVSGNTLLSDTERNQLTSKKSKFSFPIQVKLIPQEFKLDKFSLYPDQDAAKLGRALALKGVEIPSRIMTPKAFDHDLEFNLRDKKIIIEITQTIPGKSNNLNFKHQPTGGNIRAHIFDIYRKCVNTKISGKNNIVGFVILNEKWETYQHITNLIPELDKLNCNIIFTSFGARWEENCTQIILDMVNSNEL